MTGFFLHPNSKEEIIDTYEEDIIMTNENGIIIKASQISGRHYGIDAKDLLGKSVYALEKEGIFSPAITPLVLHQKKKVVLVQKTPSGSKILITGLPFFDELGKIKFIISYSYEVSELMLIQNHMKELEQEMLLAKEELLLLRKEKLGSNGLIVEHRTTKQAFETAHKAASLEVPIMIFGEYGTGKTTLAKEIHKNSTRANGPFIEVDCETLPEALFEPELFGFDDGESQKVGLLTLAQGGTLYLKGIDKLAVHLQAQLANVFQSKKYTPQRSKKRLPFDTRVISSTECELNEVSAFHKNLYYLLNVVPIQLSPLRERKDDLHALISSHLIQFSKKHHISRQLGDDVLHHLLNLDWPGNHYEVMNVIERLVVQSTATIISVNDLPVGYRLATDQDLYSIEFEGSTLPTILEKVEMKVLKSAQQRYRTTTEIAKSLGISQPTVVRKLQKYTEMK